MCVKAVLVAGATYWYAVKAARSPSLTGAEGMLGAPGRVVDVGKRNVSVFLNGELWSAEAAGEPLAVGDEAVAVGIEGLRLQVRKAAGRDPR